MEVVVVQSLSRVQLFAPPWTAAFRPGSPHKRTNPPTPPTPVPVGIFHRPALTSGLCLCLQVNQLRKRETESLASEPTGICLMPFGNRGWMGNSGWGITHEDASVSVIWPNTSHVTLEHSVDHTDPPNDRTSLWKRVYTCAHTHTCMFTGGKMVSWGFPLWVQ